MYHGDNALYFHSYTWWYYNFYLCKTPDFFLHHCCSWSFVWFEWLFSVLGSTATYWTCVVWWAAQNVPSPAVSMCYYKCQAACLEKGRLYWNFFKCLLSFLVDLEQSLVLASDMRFYCLTISLNVEQLGRQIHERIVLCWSDTFLELLGKQSLTLDVPHWYEALTQGWLEILRSFTEKNCNSFFFKINKPYWCFVNL